MIEIRRYNEPPATVDSNVYLADFTAEGVSIHCPLRYHGSRGSNNREASRRSPLFNPTRRNRSNHPARPSAGSSRTTGVKVAGSAKSAKVSVVFASAGPSGSSGSLSTFTPATITNVAAPHSPIVGISYTVSTPPPHLQIENDLSASHSSNDTSLVHEVNTPDPVD